MNAVATETLRVGVVIPAHNEAATIARTLEALLGQEYPGLVVLVVNDGSTDGTEAAVAAFPGVRQLVNRPNLGLARSIARGLDALSAEGMDVGIVLHADCVPQGGAWAASMVAPFADPSVGAVVSARRLSGRPEGAERFFDAVAPQDFPNPEGLDREILFFRDKCDAYRLSALKSLGGFDTRAFYVAGEDTDLSIRMRARGLRILQSGSATVAIGFSSHQRSLKSVLRKAVQYGGAQAVLYGRHGYDGLRARAYAAGLLALPALALALLGAPAVPWALLAAAFFLLATTCVAVAGFGELPLVLASVPAAVLLQSLGAPPASAWASGAFLAPALLAARQALKAARRMRRHGEPLPACALGFSVAGLWWFLTGAGYLGRFLRGGLSEGQTAPCTVCGGGRLRSVRRIRGHLLGTCADCGQRHLASRGPGGAEAYTSEGEAYYASRGMTREDAAAKVREQGEKVEVLGAHAKPGRLLEVGAGPGYFLAAARAAGWEAEGVEPSAWAAGHAREAFGLTVFEGPLEAFPAPERPFDAVCFWDSLEHLERPGEALERVRGWLRPGGLVVVRVPNASSLDALLQGADWPHWDLPLHLSHFDARSLGRLMRRAGLRPESLRRKPSSVLTDLVRAVLGRGAVPSWASPVLSGRCITMVARV